MHTGIGIAVARDRHLMAPLKNKKQLKAAERALQAEWARWLERIFAPKTLSEIARKAGVADNALTRVVDPDYASLLSPLTIRMICNHWQVPGPDGFETWPGLQEDVRPFDYQARGVDDVVRSVVASLLEGRPNASPKLVETSALEAAGFFLGDIIIAEQGLAPASGDAVIANIYDDEVGAATTVLRIYRKAGELGFLLPPTDDIRGEARLVDGQSTRIVSVVTQAFRPQARAGVSRIANDPTSENRPAASRPKRSQS